MIFTHSGNSGDILYSLPTIRHLAKGQHTTLYVKAAKYIYGNQYDFTRELLLQNGIDAVIPFEPMDNDWSYMHWPSLEMDYDLDKARLQKQRGRIHIIKRYFDQFEIDGIDHRCPWLKIDNYYKRSDKFALIHLTPRGSGLQYDWQKIYEQAKERHEQVYFIGFPSEHLDFTIRFGQIEHLQTETLLEFARLIRDCEAVYCNQGVALVLAQGFGKEYWLVRNGLKTNCLLYTPNEHLIGQELQVNSRVGEQPNSHFKQMIKNI